MKRYIILILLFIYGFQFQVFSQIDSTRLRKAIETLIQIKRFNKIPVADTLEKSVADSIKQINDSIENKEYQYYTNRVISYDILISSPYYYDKIRIYQKQLLPVLWKEFNIKRGYKLRAIKLMSLLDLEKSKIDSILNYPKTPVEIKAKLGDAEAEEKVISMFKGTLDHHDKSIVSKRAEVAKWLLYIHTKRTLETFFDAVGSDKTYSIKYMQNGEEILKEWSLCTNMLWFLYEFSGDELFKTPYNYVNISLGEQESYDNLSPYYELVEKRIKELYGYEVKISAPFFSRTTQLTTGQ